MRQPQAKKLSELSVVVRIAAENVAHIAPMRGRRLLEAADQAASARGCVLDQERRGAAPFAAGGEALQHAADHQQHGPEQADRRHRMGSDPWQPVATAISPTVTTSALRRPKRSPYQPITIAPTGRIRKPTAKVAKLASSEAIGSVEGKKARPIASGEESVDDEIEDLEHLADGAGQDGTADHCRIFRWRSLWLPLSPA